MVEVMGDDGEGEEVSFAHASVTSAPNLAPEGRLFNTFPARLLLFYAIFFTEDCYRFF